MATRHLLEMSVDTPTPLEAGPDILNSMAADVRAKIKSYDMKISNDGKDFAVVMARIEYQGVEPSLQGATDGAMTQSAAAMGDKSPKYSVVKTKVGGLEGRRASYQSTGVRKVQMEGLFAQRGPVIYQVQVIDAAGRAADTERIIQSVKIESK